MGIMEIIIAYIIGVISSLTVVIFSEKVRKKIIAWSIIIHRKLTNPNLNLTIIGNMKLKKEISIDKFHDKIKKSLEKFVTHSEETSKGHFRFEKKFTYCNAHINIIPFTAPSSDDEKYLIDGYNILIKTTNLKGNDLDKGLNDLTPYLYDLEMKNKDHLDIDTPKNTIECQFEELPQFIKYLSDLKLEDLTAKKDDFNIKILKDKITIEGKLSASTTDGISKMIKMSF